MRASYTAFLLPPDVRQALIDRFPPAYPQIKADHITYRYGTAGFADLFHPDTVEITGIADDNNGLQALIVKINGQQFKPDGGPYHITWSLAPALAVPDEYNEKGTYRPVHANELVARILGGNPAPGETLTPLNPPLKINAIPAFIEKDDKGNATIHPLAAEDRTGTRPPSSLPKSGR